MKLIIVSETYWSVHEQNRKLLNILLSMFAIKSEYTNARRIKNTFEIKEAQLPCLFELVH